MNNEPATLEQTGNQPPIAESLQPGESAVSQRWKRKSQPALTEKDQVSIIKVIFSEALQKKEV